MEEVVKPRTIHAANIAILVGPSKALFADDCIYLGEVLYIGIIHILTFLRRLIFEEKNLLTFNYHLISVI